MNKSTIACALLAALTIGILCGVKEAEQVPPGYKPVQVGEQVPPGYSYPALAPSTQG